MISESYLMGIRIGRSMVRYETLEMLIKDKFHEEYKIYKYKLRYLSDAETLELLKEVRATKDSSVIKKYIR